MNRKKITAIVCAAYISGSATIFPGNLTFGEYLQASVQENFYHKASAQELAVDAAASEDEKNLSDDEAAKEYEKLIADAQEARRQVEEALKVFKQAKEQETAAKETSIVQKQQQDENDNFIDGNLLPGDYKQGYEFADNNTDSNVLFDVTPPPDDDATRFDYDPGSTYQVYCRPGFTTDVQLAPGEKVLKITAGDKINWEYRYMADKNGYHLYISPTQMGIETNLIIITDKHNYQLMLATSKQFYPIVKWNYPQEHYEVQDDKNIVMEVKSVDQLNFKYNISRAEEYPWAPECVFDDGFRTFIRLAPGKADKYRPLLMIKKAGRWMLTQYAVKSGALVVGETFREGMLILGNGEQRKTVRIEKEI